MDKYTIKSQNKLTCKMLKSFG